MENGEFRKLQKRHESEKETFDKEFRGTKTEIKEAEQRMLARHADEFKELQAQCLREHGKHLDAGGMFVATCVRCGWADEW